jgi:hypothetical protein
VKEFAFQQISEETPPKQQDMSVRCESMEGKIYLSEENKDGMGKPSLKVVCSVICQ